MKSGKELKNKIFTNDFVFKYIPDEDRFITTLGKPELKFNIIGTGIMGQEHIRLTHAEGRAEVHGVYDPNPGSIEAAKSNLAMVANGKVPVVYDTLEAACNDPEADALIICTPNYSHIDVVRVAAKSGKHILLEKPMATTIKDAAEIASIAKNYKGVFQIGLQYRYKAMYVEAIYEGLERKTIGNIKMIHLMEHRLPFLDKVNQWNKFSKFSGGTLVEKCCHYFDLMNLFAQSKPKEVYATGSMAVNFKEFEYKNEKSDILDNALVNVTYENGVIGSFNLCMFAPVTYEEIVLCGDEGRIKAYECEDYLPGGRLKTKMEVMCGEGKPSRFSEPVYPTYIESGGHNGATYYEHINFIENIKGVKTNTATVEDGFWSIVVGAAAEESAKSGKTVKIADLI